jgi:hypothetical protein
MKTIKTGVVLFAALLIGAVNAESDEEVVYSTEAYCLLSNEGATSSYLAAYAKKLGMTPSKTICNHFKQIVAESRPKEWDYPGGRPYPGSVIRLSKSQIEVLKASSPSKQ